MVSCGKNNAARLFRETQEQRADKRRNVGTIKNLGDARTGNRKAGIVLLQELKVVLSDTLLQEALK